MPLIKRADERFACTVARLIYTNPFLEERIELERLALGSEFASEPHPYWSFTLSDSPGRQSNLRRLVERAEPIAQALRAKLLAGAAAEDDELQIYDDMAVYLLYYELLLDWEQKSQQASLPTSAAALVWKRYSTKFDYWLNIPGRHLPSQKEKLHLFAIFYQVHRAFNNIFACVIGQSKPAASLRARIWQSIFTHDMRRYRRSLYSTLQQVTTLILGPSGSGKELVARAIGLSRYIPFDAKANCFLVEPAQSYAAINISAFATNLVESELFGHAKGAFTDATAARAGWFENCCGHGSILLDEIGELEPTTQVKLLRLLQNRTYQRLGETKVREFQGKIIAATNRNLRAEIERGRFREDLYYRLCADVIPTPSLSDQLQDNPDVLANLVSFIVARIAPDEHASLTAEVVTWIEKHMPSSYAWPGNIRELEQCVRNIMIHAHYIPAANEVTNHESSRSRLNAGHGVSASANLEQPLSSASLAATLADDMQGLRLTADELLCRYCKLAYKQTKSFEKSAKLLQLDRRTVRAKVDAHDAT